VRRRRLALIASAVVAALAIIAGTAAFLLDQRGPAMPEPVIVTVHENQRLGDLARDLAGQGVLRHPRLFVLWAHLTGQDKNVHWGEFRLTQPLSPRELLVRLTGPPDALHTVTVPEGTTVQHVVALLAAAGLGSEDTFRRILADPHFLAAEGLPPEGAEGYLFPDTYAFPLGTQPERILQTMIRRFHEVFTGDLAGRASHVGLSPQQAVILASLVEEETARPDERPLVAAVFLNRLKKGMPLQADPTVLYDRTDGNRRITRSDLARATPYNTYTMQGLPPTPIANPGRASLEAAVDPAPVPYLYFVARGDGSHEFNVDLAKHNAAVTRYRRLERQKR
jgi:UPF0755 protein